MGESGNWIIIYLGWETIKLRLHQDYRPEAGRARARDLILWSALGGITLANFWQDVARATNPYAVLGAAYLLVPVVAFCIAYRLDRLRFASSGWAFAGLFLLCRAPYFDVQQSDTAAFLQVAGFNEAYRRGLWLTWFAVFAVMFFYRQWRSGEMARWNLVPQFLRKRSKPIPS